MSDEKQFVLDKLQTIHQNNMDHYNKNCLPLQFEVGDRVWVLKLPKSEDKSFNKLFRRWQGPYEVLDVIGTNTYSIATPEGVQKFGTDRLKLYRSRMDGKHTQCAFYVDTQPAPSDESWVVEKMISHKRKRGVLMWQVLWKKGDTTWERATQFLHNINDLWVAYNASHNLDVSIGQG